MRVIITGGTGLIGSALARALIADGHEVIALTRNPARHKQPVQGMRLVQWDGRSAAGWAELADGADAIVNLAGEGIGDGRWSEQRRTRILQSRLDAGKAVLDAIRQAVRKPRVLVQGSAVGYYGARGDEIVTEESAPGGDWLAQVVVAWENSTAAAAQMGVRRAVARTGLVFSRVGGAFPTMKLPFDLLIAGGPLGSGKQWVPWIHIDDEVRALRFLIENAQAAGPCNLCAPNPATYSQFARAMGQVMGRPSFIPAPAFALKAALGDMADMLLTGQRQQPARLLALGFAFTYPELTPALRALLNQPAAA